MVAAVETMAWTGQVPWHGEGLEVAPDLTPHEMMKAAELDWTVSKRPIFTTHKPTSEYKIVDGVYADAELLDNPDRFALMRDSDNTWLGTCSGDYQVIQNERIFDFFQKFSKHANISMETAGSLRGGKDIFGLAKLNDNFALPGGDEINGFVLFRQPHEPGYAMSILDTEVRVVCSNTLQLALRQQSAAKFTMSHRTEFNDVKEDEAL